MVTQADNILRALQHGERLTAMDILRRGWGMRAAARVNELRAAGYSVQSEIVKRGDAMVAEYSLVPAGELFAVAGKME